MKHPKAGFTLIELLVVIAIIAVLAAMLLPALNSAKQRAQAAQCMSNKKQLELACFTYTDENNDALPFNPDQSATTLGTPPWVSGLMTWDKSSDNTNTANLTDSKLSCLAAYTPQPQIYWCPADIYISPYTQGGLGWEHRVRSVAMDAAVGGGNPVSGGPGSGYKPAGNLASFYPGGMFYATTASQLRSPGPSESWVFTDEHPDSIDDGILYIPPCSGQKAVTEYLLNCRPACTMVLTVYLLPTVMRKFINGWIPEPAARAFYSSQHLEIRAASTWSPTTRI